MISTTIKFQIMGNYEQLKQAVSDVIKTNGNQEITGDVMQDALLSIISAVGVNATFTGIATPKTNPGTPDQNVFWIAGKSGVYVNFGGLTVENEAIILQNKNGSWSKINTGLALSQETCYFVGDGEYEASLSDIYRMTFDNTGKTYYDSTTRCVVVIPCSNAYKVTLSPNDGYSVALHQWGIVDKPNKLNYVDFISDSGQKTSSRTIIIDEKTKQLVVWMRKTNDAEITVEEAQNAYNLVVETEKGFLSKDSDNLHNNIDYWFYLDSPTYSANKIVYKNPTLQVRKYGTNVFDSIPLSSILSSPELSNFYNSDTKELTLSDENLGTNNNQFLILYNPSTTKDVKIVVGSFPEKPKDYLLAFSFRNQKGVLYVSGLGNENPNRMLSEKRINNLSQETCYFVGDGEYEASLSDIYRMTFDNTGKTYYDSTTRCVVVIPCSNAYKVTLSPNDGYSVALHQWGIVDKPNKLNYVDFISDSGQKTSSRTIIIDEKTKQLVVWMRKTNDAEITVEEAQNAYNLVVETEKEKIKSEYIYTLTKLIDFNLVQPFSVTSGYGDATCYNGLIFQFIDGNNYVYVHDAENGDLIQTIQMSDPNPQYHNNSVSFGEKKYENSDNFPLIYASQENSVQNKCNVYRVVGERGNMNLVLVQTIHYPTNSETNLYYHNCMIDNKNNYIIIGGLRNQQWQRDNKNIINYMYFKLPDIAQGSDIQLNILNMIARTPDFKNMPTTQGGFCYNGLLYQCFGVDTPQLFMIFDINKMFFMSQINLSDEVGNYEPEGAFVYNNRIHIVYSGGKIYKIER